MKNLIKIATILVMSLMIMTSCKKESIEKNCVTIEKNDVTIEIIIDGFTVPEYYDSKLVTGHIMGTPNCSVWMSNINGNTYDTLIKGNTKISNVDWSKDFSILLERIDTLIVSGGKIPVSVGRHIDGKFTTYKDGQQIDHKEGRWFQGYGYSNY